MNDPAEQNRPDIFEIARNSSPCEERKDSEQHPDPSSDPADIYGVAEPEKPFHPGTFTGNRARENGASPDPDNPSELTDLNEDESLSLDALYERKRRERLARADEYNAFELEKERPVLPAHPFWNRIFTPFVRPAFLLRFVMMVAVGFIPLYPATHFFSKLLTHKYLEEGYKLTHFLNGIWADKNILFLFCLLWGVFTVPYSLHVFSATADGDDQMDEWPEYNVIGGFGQFLWLAIIIMIAGTPGYFVGLFCGVPVAGLIVSALVFTPILFLACMETDTLFTLVTPTVTRSFFVLWKSWFVFYPISLILFVAMVALTVFILWGVQVANTSGAVVLLASIAVSALFSLIPILYLRYLGRLAWTITEERRNNPPQVQEEKRDHWYSLAELFRNFR